MKEVHFFDLSFDRGVAWYRGHFPTRAYLQFISSLWGERGLTGEGTPYYLYHPRAHKRIADVLPDVKLIAILRDPVTRLISHYHHERRLGLEPLSLQDALASEDERLVGEEERILAQPTYRSVSHQHHSYRARGRYAEQLDRWLSVFPSDQILLVEADRFFKSPSTEFDRVLRFLGLPPQRRTKFRPHNALRYPPAERQLLGELNEYYRPYNERLYELVGEDYGWGKTTG